MLGVYDLSQNRSLLGAHSAEAVFIGFEVFAFAFVGIDFFEEQGAAGLSTCELPMALDVSGIGSALFDFAVLEIDEVSPVLIDHLFHTVTIEEALLAGGFSDRFHDGGRVLFF